MPAPILPTGRLLLVPLADRHVELEVELDADPEVMRYISGRGRSRDEVLASHERRTAMATRVDGLGFWMAFASDQAARGSTPTATADEGDFVGLMMLPPAHGPDQPDDPTVCDLGYRLLRRFWRRGLASEASRVLLHHLRDGRPGPGDRPDHGRERRLPGRDGGRRPALRAHLPPGLRGTAARSRRGEVEYEMTREMWEAGAATG